MEYPKVDVNGVPPDLVGRVCIELVIEEYWYRGLLDVPANVIWLRVDSAWHRLYFDCGIVFWRAHDGTGPKAYDMPELEAQVRLRDLGQTLGVAGRVVRNVFTRPVERGSEVAIEWDSGDQLVFRDVDDKTGFHVVHK